MTLLIAECGGVYFWITVSNLQVKATKAKLSKIIDGHPHEIWVYKKPKTIKR